MRTFASGPRRVATVLSRRRSTSKTPHTLARVLRAVGNRGVQRLLRSTLEAARSSSQSERDADRCTDGVTNDTSTEFVGPHVEAHFGRDLSQVRVHTDDRASRLNRVLGSDAFTHGSDIYFANGHVTPRVLAHELGHAAEQAASGVAHVQRHLLLTGGANDIRRFLSMCERASGLVLRRDAATHEVHDVGTEAAPAQSQAFATHLTEIMNADPQDAEVQVGTDQPHVLGGAFPLPRDLTGAQVQQIDMDDIEAFEAGAPGFGIASLLHEMVENFEAHSHVPVAGTDLFPGAHQAGLGAESEVMTDVFGAPSSRVATAREPLFPGIVRNNYDVESFYVVVTVRDNPVTHSVVITSARIAPKVDVLSTTVDHFPTNVADLPPAGGAIALAVATTLIANPSATVLVEGFTDNVGTDWDNLVLARDRANHGALALAFLGIAPERIHMDPIGARNFVDSNATDAHRTRNRRIVYTVTRPGP